MGRNFFKKPLCSVVDADGQCQNMAWARGMCEKHYRRWYTHGSPTVKKQTGPHGRFDEKAIGDVLEARAQGETLSGIAKRYGVSKQRIWYIISRHQQVKP